MNLICVLLGLLILWLAYPYVRCLRKRIVCYRKLKKVCKVNELQLHGTHILWFLGGRKGKKYDCYIETPTSVFCIKFFGVVHHLRTLVFVEESAYLLRRHMGAMLWIHDTFDGVQRELPEYDFEYKEKEASPEKQRYPILLVNPVPVEILQQFDNGKEVILNPGDKIQDMEVYNQSQLLKRLEDLGSL